MKYSLLIVFFMGWMLMDREPGALRAVRELEQFKMVCKAL